MDGRQPFRRPCKLFLFRLEKGHGPGGNYILSRSAARGYEKRLPRGAAMADAAESHTVESEGAAPGAS